MVQILWKSVQQILRNFGSERTSRYETKLVVMATSLEILKKKFRSIICTQKAFIWCKNCKNCSLCFAYDTKLVAMATSLEELEKWTWSRKFTQIPSIWWKDRENRSSRYWDSFAPSKKKKKKLRKVKYIARSASNGHGFTDRPKFKNRLHTWMNQLRYVLACFQQANRKRRQLSPLKSKQKYMHLLWQNF